MLTLYFSPGACSTAAHIGKQFFVANAYGLVFYGWGVRSEYPIKQLANYTAWKDRMLKRPTVMKVLQSELNALVKQ